MFAEADLVPISGIQHMLFCPRQYALIHLEQLWSENRYTAEGRVLHERVDEEHHESRKAKRTEYGLAIRSLKYGLIGKADVVELGVGPTGSVMAAKPVEYKRGRKKEEDWDRVQLCAQALCLEEMFEIAVDRGEIFYQQDHRRTEVAFDKILRATTLKVIADIRTLEALKTTPLPQYAKEKCDRCSLYDLCMPKVLGKRRRSVASFIQSQIAGGFGEQML